MAQDHDHSGSHAHHDHDHDHSKPVVVRNLTRTFLIGILLNSGFVAIEAIYGFLSHSLSLLADAGHNLGDVLGLALAGGAAYLSQKSASDRYSYGLKSTSILAALINAAVLLIASGAIILESVQRFLNPEAIESTTVMIVAAVGILVNGFTAYLFSRENHEDLNVRGAFLHMLSDALISAGVVISALIYRYTGWTWLDPVFSIFISATICLTTVKLLRESINLSLHAVPSQIDLNSVREFLLGENGVSSVHDLHIWAMSTTEIALTCHLTTKNTESFLATGRLQKISAEIDSRFGICHSTIQVDHESDVVSCVNDSTHEHH